MKRSVVCATLIGLDCSQLSVFSYFIPSLNARIESRKNWTLAPNGRLDRVRGGDRGKIDIFEKSEFPLSEKRKIAIG